MSGDTAVNEVRTTHTPGPWKTSRDRLSGNHGLVGDGMWFAKISWTVRDDRNEADARLIAAAPDLLELSRFLIERLDDFERDPLQEDDGEYTLRQFAGHVSPAIERLRAAIASAEPTS